MSLFVFLSQPVRARPDHFQSLEFITERRILAEIKIDEKVFSVEIKLTSILFSMKIKMMDL